MTDLQTDLALAGLGCVCALGAGAPALAEGLAGRRAPRRERAAPPEPGAPARAWLTAHGEEELDRFMPRRAQRRLGRLDRLALLAAHLAVEDSGLAPGDPTRVGIVFGTGHGPLSTTFAFQDGLIDGGDANASPTLFAGSVHNALAAQVSLALGLQGPAQTVTAFGATPAAVFTIAHAWLATGAVDCVLAGLGDEYHPLLADAATAPLAEAPDPLDMTHGPFISGEGFIVFLLTRAPAAARYGRLTRVATGLGAASLADTVKGTSALFWAAPGRRALAPAEAEFLRRAPALPVSTHAALYGAMPVALGFELAAAALTLRAAGGLDPAAAIACVSTDDSADDDGGLTLLTLTGPASAAAPGAREP